jgi:hypothetical protein
MFCDVEKVVIHLLGTQWALQIYVIVDKHFMRRFEMIIELATGSGSKGVGRTTIEGADVGSEIAEQMCPAAS